MEMTTQLLSALNEQGVTDLMEQYQSFGPLVSILLAFLISFVPPLPTMLVIGLNGASNGLWAGFVFSWIGVMAGILTVFGLVRQLSHYEYVQRFANRKSISKSLEWIQKNGFIYLFMFSLLPFGPFTMMHIAAGLSGIRFRTFLAATALGRAIMIFTVSYIGSDLSSYMENPWQLLPVVLFIALGFLIARKMESWFGRGDDKPSAVGNLELELEQEPTGCKSGL
ncbi:TVP38/TMEM64 family protein [Paenibacillus sp. Z6-24]